VAWPAEFSAEGGMLSVQVRDTPRLDAEDLEWFVAEPALVEHAAAAFIDGVDGTLQLSQPLSPFFSAAPDRLEMLLIDRAAARGWLLEATPGRFETTAANGEDRVRVETLPLAVVLLMALAGGVLLNLMPCVFPVLSIKALSLVSSGTAQRAGAAAYTAGVLVSFAVLAALLLGLRAGGEAIGWGFQLQAPWFVALLVYLLFALALSLSGLYEFGGGFGGLGQRLTERPGLSGSFFTGVLAALVASPCTAPFMGTALGLAVLLPGAQAMLVFLFLGLGLALPLAAIGFIPALARRLPRPGPWMVSFRQAMAFPLYLTVVWLLWVLGRQTGADGVAAVLAGLVALAFALWLAGRHGGRGVLESLRHVAVAFALIAALAAVGAANRLLPDDSEPAETWWEPWSEQRLDELRSTGQSVFVNMTADWCVTCLVNERVALEKDIVREAFAEAGVIYLKGDWTRRDPAITRYLEQFGRNGVPLYVYYPGDAAKPTVLPQLLSPSTVLAAIGISIEQGVEQ
jgi:thiol:disulfide interchange protein DsbD